MTVDTYQKYQERFEASANILYQLKQRDQPNKGHGDTDISAVEVFVHVSIYPLL